jgi:hypothetical protein
MKQHITMLLAIIACSSAFPISKSKSQETNFIKQEVNEEFNNLQSLNLPPLNLSIPNQIDNSLKITGLNDLQKISKNERAEIFKSLSLITKKFKLKTIILSAKELNSSLYKLVVLFFFHLLAKETNSIEMLSIFNINNSTNLPVFLNKTNTNILFNVTGFTQHRTSCIDFSRPSSKK